MNQTELLKSINDTKESIEDTTDRIMLPILENLLKEQMDMLETLLDEGVKSNASQKRYRFD